MAKQPPNKNSAMKKDRKEYFKKYYLDNRDKMRANHVKYYANRKLKHFKQALEPTLIEDSEASSKQPNEGS